MINMENKIDTVKYSKAKKILDNIGEKFEDKDVDISFEFIIGSFFPEILGNIKDTMAKEYIRGYNEGNRDKSKEKFSPAQMKGTQEYFKQAKTYLELALNNIKNAERMLGDAPFHGWSGSYLKQENDNIVNMKELLKYTISCCDEVMREEI